MAGTESGKEERRERAANLIREIDALTREYTQLEADRVAAKQESPTDAKSKFLEYKQQCELRISASGRTQALGRRIEDLMREVCHWDLDGDETLFNNCRTRFKRTRKDARNQRDFTWLLDALLVYKSVLRGLLGEVGERFDGMEAAHAQAAPAADPNQKSGRGSRGPDPDKDRNKTIAETADGISSGRLSDEELLKLCVEMDRTPHRYGKTKPELRDLGDITWVKAFELRLYQNIRDKVGYARKMYRKLQLKADLVPGSD